MTYLTINKSNARVGTIIAALSDIENFSDIENYILADGRELSCKEYPTLFALIGTRFGGSGDTFKLPNLSENGKCIHYIKWR